jgi:hypothetical protein
MTIVLYFSVMIINLIFVILRKKSKLIFLLNAFIFSLIYYGNIRSGDCDLTIYRMQYEHPVQGTLTDMGYAWFTKTLSSAGIPFNGFLLIIFVMFLIAVLIFSYQYQCNYSVFFLLFGLFYYFFTLEVLRFFIATTFLLTGCSFLIKRKTWLYLIFLALAASFHITFLAFVLLLFANMEKFDKKFYRMYAILFMTICLVTILNGRRVPFASTIFNLFTGTLLGEKNVSFYNGSVTAQHSWVYSSLYYIFNFLLLYTARNLISNAEESGNVTYSSLERLYQFCFRSNCLLGVVMPFAMMSPTYFRIPFFVTLLIFILLAGIYGQCYESYYEHGRFYISSNVITKNSIIIILAVIFAWTAIWYYVNPNDASMIYALKQNMFY